MVRGRRVTVGQKDGESTGHRSGRRIVKLLEKNKSDYTDDDLEHMRKVTGYVKRHPGQGRKVTPGTPGGATRPSTGATIP